MSELQRLRQTTTLPRSAPGLPDDWPQPERDARLGRYLLIRLLGEGGMGLVYEAYDPELDRKVALKLLRREQAPHSRPAERHLRLLREARALARLSDPNVVAVHDAGTIEGRVFLAMELVRGRTLQEWLHEEKPGWPSILAVFRQAGQGLAAAHEAGLLHRDFKPSNVMVGLDGRVRVLDFGLARGQRVPAGSESSDSDTTLAGGFGAVWPAELTQTGARIGTPAYMAPEQHRGLETDARSDQFSFCVALYEALCGELPFAGECWSDFVSRVCRGEVREASIARLPVRLRRALMRGLRPEPDQRYPSMQALLDDLEVAPRQRRLIMALAVGVVLAATAGVTWWSTSTAGACRFGEAKLEEVWDAPRRGALRRSFLATELPYATDAWLTSERLLDAYTADWLEVYTDACEATHLRREQSDSLLDMRMACLDARLKDLRATTDLLRRADGEVVRHAVRAVSSLRPLASCSDAELLLARAPLPGDEATQREIGRLEEAVAKARALRNAGRIQEALPLSRKAARESDALGFAPLAAEAYHALGRTQQADSDFAAAAEALLKAVALAEEAHDDERRSMALLDLVWVVGYRQGDFTAGQHWLELAEGVLRRLGEPRRFAPDRHHAAAVLDLAAGDYSAAARQARAAVDARIETAGPHHRDTAHALSTLGRVQYRRGELEAALATFRRIADIRRKLLGENHPELAAVDQSIGEILRSLGRYEEALHPLGKALDAMRQSFGSESPQVATVLTSLGTAHLKLGRFDASLAELSDALEIRRHVYGEGHAAIAKSLNNLALLYRELGRPDQAETLLLEALAIHEKADGPEHPSTLLTASNLARIELLRKRHRGAEARFRQVRDSALRTLGSDHLTTVMATLGLAEALLSLGRVDTALPLLEETLSVVDRRSFRGEVRAHSRFALARALRLDERDGTRALELARAARELFQGAGDAGGREVARIDAWLAEAGE